MFRLSVCAVICKISYLIVKHHDKLFNKWCDTYSKYQKKDEKIYKEIN